MGKIMKKVRGVVYRMFANPARARKNYKYIKGSRGFSGNDARKTRKDFLWS